IYVIYNAVSEQFKPAAPVSDTERPYLLAVSSPNYHKNFHGLIAAFSKMANSQDVTLKIIGAANKNFADVGFSTKEGAANDNIQFLGRVSDQQLVELYSHARAFVFPSLYEGFGIPPLEAQACGCAVVSSNRASLPEVLLQSALYFEPENIPEMQQALERIIQDEALRQTLIAEGFENVKRFDWMRSAAALSEIMTRAM
ncbi:glycosyltransferase family 4 protein, partial [Serratia marcescens]|uniref:glycosyltransferase family 4 protein n=2 Tax=Pseudomonadota TaxID=1224 RepID=UPI00107591B3